MAGLAPAMTKEKLRHKPIFYGYSAAFGFGSG
jgi:hypothetical protein